MASPPSSPAAPEIYAAARATDGSDAVDRGAKLTEAEAVARRQAGQDIVICGPDTIRNDVLARKIEQAATPPRGKCIYHGPHGGPLSLPHWQQEFPPPDGHSFHETNRRQARTPP
jgi:hypothetical protein